MRTRSQAAPTPPFPLHGSPPFRETRIPIVDSAGVVVAWTTDPPEVVGMNLRHRKAEKLLGGPIDCAYVELRDPDAAATAGAPPGWNGPWRCLVIAPRR